MVEPTIVEAVGESHHVHGYIAAVGTVEHPLLGQFGVKGNLPEALEVEGIKEDQTGLIRQRSRCQELRDGTCRRKSINQDLFIHKSHFKHNKMQSKGLKNSRQKRKKR